MTTQEKAHGWLSESFQILSISHKMWLPAATAMRWYIHDPEKHKHVPCETACTDGRSTWINAEFFCNLTPPQRLYLLVHELMHPLLNHISRLSGWPRMLANVAADFEVNNMLDEYGKLVSGLQAPPNGVSDTALGTSYGGLAAENILEDLLKKRDENKKKQKGKGRKSKGQKGDGDGGDGGEGDGDDDDGSLPRSIGEFIPDTIDNPGEDGNGPSDEERQAAARMWAEVRDSMVAAARQAGHGHGGFIEKLEKLNRPVITLESMLERVMSEIIPTDDGQFLDRRFLYNHDLVIPDDTRYGTGTVVFMKDTSGSVSSREAAAVLAIVSDAVANLHARRFVVIDVDTQVGRVEDLVPGEACQSDFVGRGGTDLRVGFNWIETHAEDAKILIVFTDGETPFPESPPPYPVVWIHFGSAPSYPFGDVVDITTLIANTQ